MKNNIEFVNFKAPLIDTELTILTYSIIEGLMSPLIQHTSEKVVETLGLDPESQYYIEASLRTGTYLAAGMLVRGMRTFGTKKLYQRSALFRRFWQKTEDLQEKLQVVTGNLRELSDSNMALSILTHPTVLFLYGTSTGVTFIHQYADQLSPLTTACIIAAASIFMQEYGSRSYGLGLGLGSSLFYQLGSSNVIDTIFATARSRIWGLSRFMIPEGHFGLSITEAAQKKFIDALEFKTLKEFKPLNLMELQSTSSYLEMQHLSKCELAKNCINFKVNVKNATDSVNIIAYYNGSRTTLTLSEFSLLVKRMIRDVITSVDGKIWSYNVPENPIMLRNMEAVVHCFWQSVIALPNAKNYSINHLPKKEMYFTDNFANAFFKASEKFCYYFDHPPQINEIGFASLEVVNPTLYPLYGKEFHPFNPALYASVPKMRGETIDHLKPYLQPIAPLTNKNFLSRRETLYIAGKAKEAGIKPQLLEAAICIGKWFNSFLRTSSYPSLPHLQANYITRILEQVYPGLQEAEYQILWTTFLGKKRIESGDLEKGKINPTVDFFLRLIEAESAYRSNQHSSKVPLFERYVEKVEASRLVRSSEMYL